MSLRIARCVPADSATIGFLEATPVIELQKIQLGTANLESFKKWVADSYSAVLSRANAGIDDGLKAYLKVEIPSANGNATEAKMIAYAEWELPDDANTIKTSNYIEGEPPEGMNSDFTGDMGDAVTEMRNRVLQGRKCFLLNQLYTLPQYQRRGAATLLISWAFEQADREGLLVYLDSEANGQGVALYEKLGFEKVDECHVDLRECGLEGVYTHVAMVRKPKGGDRGV